MSTVTTSLTISTYVQLVKSTTVHFAVPIAPNTAVSPSLTPIVSMSADPSTELWTAHEDFRPSFSATGGLSVQENTKGIVSSASPIVQPANTHTIITQSKAEIFKPKALSVEADNFEPCTVKEALADPEWKLAVQAEFDAFMSNSTWKLVSLPRGRKVPGCDFKETFSLVVKPVTIQTILVVAVSRSWQLCQVDVNNAFLNSDLTDEVFLQQPPSYVQSGLDGEQLVCRLTKALYGLRQALHSALMPGKYIRDLLDRSSLTNAKSVHTPMVNSSTLSKDEGERLSDPMEYRSLAGALQYMVLTRPDITYVVNRVYYLSSVMLMPIRAWILMIAGLQWDIVCTLAIHPFCELHIYSTDSPTIWYENSSVVAVAANPVLHSKFKHVELDLFFVRKKVAEGSLVVGEIPTRDQVADVFTKLLSVSLFTRY
ncbi:putative LRR receptor-like serine/threonine-protein kinase [Gossypium australe]|uniref:Putative LRR receptor-like serine/threonine-protein kinase n=1 Tax=Gossypium australe TaxID=47621 RepID=A0A5B6W449_9ROSI|nr:putative LRR receptor-like serine/threonine-protein kinase [Gossypium australe]